MHSTHIVLDTNCLKHLRSPDDRSALEKRLRVIDGTVLPSAINLIEVLRQPDSRRRGALIATIRALAADRPLLPWPYALLDRVARALLEPEYRFQLEPSGLEPLLHDPASAKLRAQADRTAKRLEQQFSTMHRDARPQVRQFVRERGLDGQWQGAREFLDEMWMQPSHIDDYIVGVWRTLKLPEPAPVAEIRENPTWRAYFEANGVAAYEQGILPSQPRPFGVLDLLQLTYPTGFPLAIFVTDDKPLLRAAQVVINEKVPGARAISWQAFLAA